MIIQRYSCNLLQFHKLDTSLIDIDKIHIHITQIHDPNWNIGTSYLKTET